MKTCQSCGEGRPSEDFVFGKTVKNVCRACRNAYQRTHYLENKGMYNRRARQNQPVYRRRNKEFVWAHLADHPCVDCGEADPVVLEFDHAFWEKHRNISAMVAATFSIDALAKEIALCEVRCANCHKRVTALRAGYYASFVSIISSPRSTMDSARHS